MLYLSERHYGINIFVTSIFKKVWKEFFAPLGSKYFDHPFFDWLDLDSRYVSEI